ncbi:MAG: Aldo-keto reductase family 1 member C1 [Promethearchaeota archaeon CR_4]|nr:MAG: Aldo-keto reductase family 1 member C1 [Candidatus Lokiarchaeota archaeon CR_4]
MLKFQIKTPTIGLGCWAIGGNFFGTDGKVTGYSGAKDEESIRAIQRAIELGVKVFDTADYYGCGHSEELLGKTLADSRKEFTIISKFGNTFDIATKHGIGTDASPKYIRTALADSLKRLKTDYLDIYLLHLWDYPADAGQPVMDTLDDLVIEGKIRGYGWSTDSTSRAKTYASRENYVAIESELNLFKDTHEIVALCEKERLLNLIRTPLAMGLLGGKYTRESQLPSDDIRTASPEWIAYFKNGQPTPGFLQKLESVKQILTEDGRTVAQGALGWILARTPNAVILPGFKNARQVEENITTLKYGALKPSQMKAIDDIMGSRLTNYE